MPDEQPQSQIDHAAAHAIARREMLLRSERRQLQAIADYHVNVGPYALQLQFILRETERHPELLTDNARKVIAFLRERITDHHVCCFGMDPSWPTSPKADKDL